MTAKRRSASKCTAAASRRRGVLWLAVCAFVAQLFLTTTHIHIDEEGWVDLPLAQFSHAGPAARLHAHHHGGALDDSPANAPAGHHHYNHSNCQICQSVPVVSASLATAPIEVLPPLQELAAGLIANSDQIAITEAFSRHQPRAPPALA